jgi:hypothetical protein
MATRASRLGPGRLRAGLVSLDPVALVAGGPRVRTVAVRPEESAGLDGGGAPWVGDVASR